MRSESYTDNQSMNDASTQDANACPNCNTLMPHELRFCRACGCRLGEGVEEYTETVRFQNAASTSRAGKTRTASAVSPPTSPTGVKDWGGLAHKVSGNAARSLTTGLIKGPLGHACRRVPRWVIWVILPLFLVSMISGPSNRTVTRNRARTSAAATASNSFLGAHYKTANGGAFIEDVLPPGSAADKAELIGGDTILSFDGKPVKSDSDLTNLLINTPPGKTVEVVYTRDGETKKTKLTTVSEEENGRLEEAFDEGPKGFLGVETDKFKLVQIPGENIYGVQMNEVFKNRPAYIAGLRDGDIVISFNGTPIRTPEELNRRIDRAQPDSTVKIIVVRGTERLEIPVKMGEE